VNVTAPLVALGIIGVVVAVVVLAVRALTGAMQRRTETQRANALGAPAAQLGLLAIGDLPPDLPPFELLNTGKDRRAANILGGSAQGHSIVVFDYTFFDTQNKVFGGVHYFKDLAGSTVACVKGSWLNLPAFVMEPSLVAAFHQAEAQVGQQLGTGRMATAAKALMSLAEGIAGTQPGWDFPDLPDVP